MARLQFSTHGDVLVALFTAHDIRDPAEVQQVSAELLAAVEQTSSRKLLLDFRNLKLISSEMVGQLFVLINRCEARHVGVKACGLSNNIRLILETVRILSKLEVHPNEAEAREAFGGEPVVGDDPLEFEIHPEFLPGQRRDGRRRRRIRFWPCATSKGVAWRKTWLRLSSGFAVPPSMATRKPNIGSAWCMPTAINVPLDYEAAVRWYQIAAKQGQARRPICLGDDLPLRTAGRARRRSRREVVCLGRRAGARTGDAGIEAIAAQRHVAAHRFGVAASHAKRNKPRKTAGLASFKWALQAAFKR